MPPAKTPKPVPVKPVQVMGILRKTKSMLLFTGLDPPSHSYHLIEANIEKLTGQFARFTKSDCTVHRSRRERCSVHEWVVDVSKLDVKGLELALKQPLESAPDPETEAKGYKPLGDDNGILSPFSFIPPPPLFATGLTFQKPVQTILKPTSALL